MESLNSVVIIISTIAFMIGFIGSQFKPFQKRIFRIISYVTFGVTFLIISFTLTIILNVIDGQIAGYTAGIWLIWYYIGVQIRIPEKEEKLKNLKTIWGILTVITSLISITTQGLEYSFQSIIDVTKLTFGLVLIIPIKLSLKKIPYQRIVIKVNQLIVPPIIKRIYFRLKNGLLDLYIKISSDVKLSTKLRRVRKELELERIKKELSDLKSTSNEINGNSKAKKQTK